MQTEEEDVIIGSTERFDKVPQDFTLRKISVLGTDRRLINWLKALLIHRLQTSC
jgi:hypothetical protein